MKASIDLEASGIGAVNLMDATPVQLDWLVANCLAGHQRGYVHVHGSNTGESFVVLWGVTGNFQPTSNQEHGGKLIDDYLIGTYPSEAHPGTWAARRINTAPIYGPTRLIAAVRCFLSDKYSWPALITEPLLLIPAETPEVRP